MSTLQEILIFLIRVFGSLYLTLILLRFLLQAARADFYNPISQLLVKLTNPLLIPLRKVIPGFWGVDLASLVLAIAFHWLVMQLVLFVSGIGWGPPLHMIGWSLIALSLNIINIYLFAGFVLFITSFIAPYSTHPALLLVRQLLEPILAPVRRFVPAVGGLDFSLFFAGIFLVVLRIVVVSIGRNIQTPFGLLIGYT